MIFPDAKKVRHMPKGVDDKYVIKCARSVLDCSVAVITPNPAPYPKNVMKYIKFSFVKD